MRLFLYGSLLDPDILAHRGGNPRLGHERQSATLSGWRRVCLVRTRWPTLRRGRGTQVEGIVVRAPAASLLRLAAYEGPSYRLIRVVVCTARGKTAAGTWIAPGGTLRPWKG